ncbi:MAG: DUF4405 domain-containing protein [Candidatus Omnitrophica bacterium]|nr:DUF4405 domain-containing protein [Candidatus Omnitrophota bacterium]MCM8791493.1 DUF4405 domain-containing protein [Candidatus Omnitrophota bacterium]
MNRAKTLKVVNAALLVSFLAQTVTALIIYFGIDIPDMKLVYDIHEHNGMIMIVLVLVHVALNWGWIKANFFKR